MRTYAHYRIYICTKAAILIIQRRFSAPVPLLMFYDLRVDCRRHRAPLLNGTYNCYCYRNEKKNQKKSDQIRTLRTSAERGSSIPERQRRYTESTINIQAASRGFAARTDK